MCVCDVKPLQQGDVRFSLDALTIPRDVSMSIPTHLGLHHHGEEPVAAGYTLDELLHLAQSSVPQQRVLALQTLAVLVTRVSDAEQVDVDDWPKFIFCLQG